jgi:chromosome partitioning protein
MIVSVTSLKGGVGKSTLSTNLAVCFAHMGYKVAIVDTDMNMSSVHWSGLRSEERPSVAVFGITDSDALRKNVKKLHEDYELIVIDGKPTISKLVSTIIMLGDVVLIPLKPSGLDIWATEQFLEKYEQAKTLKDVKAYFVLNEYDPNLNLSKETKEALKEFEIPTLESTLKTRVSYKEAIVVGEGVYEYHDRKAKKEIRDLTEEVLKLLQANQ